MLGHIYSLINRFEQSHGISPNLLYLNPIHYEHLKAALDESYTLTRIIELLHMDIIIQSDRIHPHAVWIHAKQRIAS